MSGRKDAMIVSHLSRRRSLQLALAGGAAAMTGSVAGAVEPSDPFDGGALCKLVEEYDALGEHRVSSRADNATTVWLTRKMRAAGLAVSQQTFPYPLYEPTACAVKLGEQAIEAFPAWPPVMTPPEGLHGEIAPHDAPSVEGKIALVRLERPAASWEGVHGEAVKAALGRGAIAAIAITEGPTGEIIALNAAPEKFVWTAPVVIAGGKDGAVLQAAASSGVEATLVSRGRQTPGATAQNVIGRRKGAGKTIVVTTPKSGWFHCAGERGTGIALFLAAAGWLVRETSCDLLFAASSGHEINFLGSDYFLKAHAPGPEAVRLWLHIGANAGVQATSAGADGVKFLGTAAPGRLTVSEALMPAAARAFAGRPGYEHPVAFTEQSAIGELVVFRKGGYRTFAGMLGLWPLFHTRLDRAAVATTPAAIEATARAMGEFLRSQS
jgi:hypothetical protein